jgi:uncharacterized protein YkwD
MTVAYESGETYTLAFQAVRDKAPSASGVYTIYTPQRWVYIGESADIRQSLLQHLNEPTACMARCGPLSFSFEIAGQAERVSRRQALVAELVPACNPVTA